MSYSVIDIKANLVALAFIVGIQVDIFSHLEVDHFYKFFAFLSVVGFNLHRWRKWYMDNYPKKE